MAKFRMVRVDFWRNPVVSEEMSPEDKYFYLYLLTNPNTGQNEMLQEKQPVVLKPMLENSILENPCILNPEQEAVKEIIEFWDDNGFGYSNLNAKQQLL